MEKAELKELIAENNLNQAFIELGKILYDKEYLYNVLISIRRRYNDIKWNNQLGILGHEEWSTEINKIAVGLMDLIDKIDNWNSETVILKKNEKKEIAIEEAIEWLSNAMLDIRISEKKHKKNFNI